jgi:hypothetical protein
MMMIEENENIEGLDEIPVECVSECVVDELNVCSVLNQLLDHLTAFVLQ